MTFHTECPVCDGRGEHRTIHHPRTLIPCAWCNHAGRVTETQRQWLLEEAAHLYLPGRDDEKLAAEYRDEFASETHHELLGTLATGLEQAVAHADHQDITRLAREIGILQ